jgi:hypothetical protein
MPLWSTQETTFPLSLHIYKDILSQISQLALLHILLDVSEELPQMNFSTRQLYKAKIFDRKRKFFCYCGWVCRWKPAARMHTRVSRTRYLRDTALFLSCTSKGSTRQATKLTRPRNTDRSLPALPRPLRSSLKGGTKNAIWSRLCACLGICSNLFRINCPVPLSWRRQSASVCSTVTSTQRYSNFVETEKFRNHTSAS